MTIAWLSKEGDGVARAYQCMAEGHTVKTWMKFPSQLGEHLLQKVTSEEEALHDADLVVHDMTGLASALQRDKVVFGNPPLADRLELERKKGREVLAHAGVAVPWSQEFQDVEQCKAFLRQHPQRWVLKISGSDHSPDSFVGNEPKGQDVLDHLEHVGEVKSVELQEYVQGIELGIGSFWARDHYVYPLEYNMEFKRLCAGDIGPNTGEMGSLLWLSNRNTRFYQATLAKVAPALRLMDFSSYVDLNCIVTKEKAYVLEWTVRFGYPEIHIHTELLDEPFGQLLYDVATGKKETYRWHEGFALGVVCAGGTFPYEEGFAAHAEGVRVRGLDQVAPEHLHFTELAFENGQHVIRGTVGYPLVVTGRGRTVEEAQARTYERVRKIQFEGLYYRNDIGERAKTQLPQLRQWGWI